MVEFIVFSVIYSLIFLHLLHMKIKTGNPLNGFKTIRCLATREDFPEKDCGGIGLFSAFMLFFVIVVALTILLIRVPITFPTIMFVVSVYYLNKIGMPDFKKCLRDKLNNFLKED